MPAQSASSPPATPGRSAFLIAFFALLLVLGALFRPAFETGQVHFANDGPLGAIMAQSDHSWNNFLGYWSDLNWLGGQVPSGFPDPTHFLLAVLGPVAFAKFYAPITLLLLGLSAWLFFRQLRLGPWACGLAALATALNTDPFSRACWGVGAWNVTWAMAFLALAALASPSIKSWWLKGALGGLAVGMSVMEGFDTGAIYSLYIAAFAFFLRMTEPGEPAKRAMKGVALVALVAAFAAFMAAQAVTVLIGTQIKGVAGTGQDAASKEQRWNFATQWSLPKAETLRVIIPGLFGYRMIDNYTTAPETAYWGTVGQHPGYETHHQGYARHSGSGEYAGVLVVLVALWAAAQSFRKKDSVFSDADKRMIWFWGGVAVVSLVLAWGRHAPLYRVLYELPYFSTIRNPIKFMHQFHLGLLVLFAYGVQGLWRRHLEGLMPEGSLIAHLKSWWKRTAGFDKQFAVVLLLATAASALGWLMYASSRAEVKSYLEKNGYGPQAVQGSPEIAAAIVKFSIGEVGWFLLFLALSVALLICIVSGALAGTRARWTGVFLGLLLVVDLSRAAGPWIVFFDYQQKYASNQVIDALRKDKHEQRVTFPPLQGSALLQNFYGFYHNDWLQYHFPFYNIQTLDIAQESRVAQDKVDYVGALMTSPGRYWQLTNTRFLLGLVGMEVFLNQNFDPQSNRFRLAEKFNLAQASATAPIQTIPTTNGPFALIEFTGALPRAALYSQWQTAPGGTNTLQALVSPAFDPTRLVLVDDKIPAPDPTATNAAVPVKSTSYAPKRITFSVKADAPSVLLLNDRFDPGWKVRVDGQPATLLRCNFIMRGVHLMKGEHTVEFRFQPAVTSFYVSFSAVILALVLCCVLPLFRERTTVSETPETTPKPAEKPGVPANAQPAGGKRKSK